MPSFFAQGLMDLGRTVCTPKNPSCSFCPIKTECKAYEKGVQHQIPMAAKKAIVPVKYAKCWVPLQSNHVFLEKRTQKGLLSGLWQVPITDFMHDTQSLPQEGATIGTITHVFSHFKLWVDIEMVDHNPALGAQQKEGVWVKKQDLHMYALSTLMKKILKKAGIL
jgi:A/G-specific adenine glycosylase